MAYPDSPRGNTIDNLHGVPVADPYRWLENPHSAETQAWTEAQNIFTRAALDGPQRDVLLARLTTLYDYRRTGSPLVRGGCYLFQHNPGLLDQPRLYAKRAWTADAEIVLDPNTLSEDGTSALTALEPSPDGLRFAYAVSIHGSDRQEVRVRELGTPPADLPDRVAWVKFASIAWTADGAAFYYLRFPEPGTVPPEDEQYHGAIYFHRLGDLQHLDVRVFAHPQPEVVPLVHVTEDDRWLVITAQRGASDDSEIYLVDRRHASPPRPLLTGFDATYDFAGGHQGQLLFKTTHGAPMGRIVAIDPERPDRPFVEVVPEASDKLSAVVMADSTLALVYLHNASDRLVLFDLDASLPRDITLPSIGSIVTLDADPAGSAIVFSFTSFTLPTRSFRLETTGGALEPLDVPGDGGGVAVSADYDTRQVWYRSKDGAAISMFLVHARDLPRDGRRPVLLSGYGGFNISRTPAFDPGNLPVLERGGIFALANLRGGGEYGEAWHQAGMLDRKQNVFDDFIAAAEFLIDEGYTTTSQLAIEGGSNGGLLVGACMTQRPDLFGAVICRVPVADMLRYHLFTVGRFWIPEYGSADDPDQFRALLAYSPYHRVCEDVAYPPTLVMTAETDDRVDPGMAKKFAARLQAARGGPGLIRIETRAGHGAGKPVAKLIEEDADILAFLVRSGMLPAAEGAVP